jgi:hypothetical protein
MGTRKIGGLFLLVSSLLAVGPGQQPLTGDEILAKQAQTASRRRAALSEYTGTRHYRIRNKRFSKEATGTVRMSYSDGQGAHLQVVASAGSEKMTGILQRIVGSEEELSRPAERSRSDLTPANYSAKLIGTETVGGRQCYVLAVTPRMRSKHLIEGKAYVDAATFGLMRVEGQFAASVSAFLGRPYFVQDFAEVGGYWLPAHAHATSSSFFLGVSELDVVYLEYEVGRARYQTSQTLAENFRARAGR